MTDEIRNILDAASTFSDAEVLTLLHYAQKRKSSVMDTVMFFRRHNQVSLAMDWLREQGDKKLCKLAEVLPKYFKKLDSTPPDNSPTIVINRNEQSVSQSYGENSNCPIINL